MILVDSCVWIDLFRGDLSPQVRFLKNLSLTLSQEICLSHVIFFEVLRGIRSNREHRRIKNFFLKLKFQDYLNQDFEKLTEIYLYCQKKGFLLPKLGDWLILKTTLDHSLELLTSDKDFKKLNEIYSFPLVVV